MRRVFAVLLMLALCLSFCACGTDKKKEAKERQEDYYQAEIDRANKALDKINEAQKKSEEVDKMIEQYKNGR